MTTTPENYNPSNVDFRRYRYHSDHESLDRAATLIDRLYLTYYQHLDYLIVVENGHVQIWIADKIVK